MILKLKNIFFQDEMIHQFIKFCIMGSIGFIFNYSIFVVLYRFLNVYYIIASATGFILAIFLAFYLNNRFTFNAPKDTNQRIRFIKYFSVNCFSLLLGLATLSFFVEILYINVYLANFLSLGVTTVSNFTGSKFFAFRKIG